MDKLRINAEIIVSGNGLKIVKTAFDLFKDKSCKQTLTKEFVRDKKLSVEDQVKYIHHPRTLGFRAYDINYTIDNIYGGLTKISMIASAEEDVQLVIIKFVQALNTKLALISTKTIEDGETQVMNVERASETLKLPVAYYTENSEPIQYLSLTLGPEYIKKYGEKVIKEWTEGLKTQKTNNGGLCIDLQKLPSNKDSPIYYLIKGKKHPLIEMRTDNNEKIVLRKGVFVAGRKIRQKKK